MTDQNQTSQDPALTAAIQELAGKASELKEVKKFIKDIENDVPMELEDLMISLKDLRKQAKELKDEHLKNLLAENADYVEYRERVQDLKEDIANAKLALFTAAANQSREHGDIDKTVTAAGEEHRLQTQREVIVYLNGKVVK